ncbi:phospholipase A2-like [Peromyscus eremicus]|uniref:phospholipase A2-like n=1 Tax=Peromyscus eremicus TaxID=42410 RepID=UPI0027DD2E6E|nr:phospholipase A2-like [Peromyscus eremicus]
MKLLLLVTLLTGATARSISRRAVWQFRNAFDCTFTWIDAFSDYNYYGCYCGLFSWNDLVEDVDRCCRTRDNCLAQVYSLENCGVLIKNPYTSPYAFSCSGNEITCSDKNNPCEAFICNCDRQAAICFSNTPYIKYYKGNGC